MVTKTDENRVIKPRSEREIEIPLRRLIITISIFGVWSVGVSIAHAAIPSFDLASAIIAEIAVVPVLLLVLRQLSITWGDKTAVLIPAPIAGRNVEEVFEEANPAELSADASDDTVLNLEGKEPELSPAVTSDVKLNDLLNYSLEHDGSLSDLDDAERNALFRVLDRERGVPINTALNSIATASDDVIFVRLRTQVEMLLRRLGTMFGIPKGASYWQILDGLVDAGVIGGQQAYGISQLLELGSRQLHGAPVPPAVADYARSEGEELLSTLSQLPRRLERDTVQSIANLALSVGLDVSRKSGIDLIVGDDLAIEVKAGGTEYATSLAILQVRRFLLRNDLKHGLVVCRVIPNAEYNLEIDASGTAIGVAWKRNGGFDGGPTAQQLAPWLFGKR